MLRKRALTAKDRLLPKLDLELARNMDICMPAQNGVPIVLRRPIYPDHALSLLFPQFVISSSLILAHQAFNSSQKYLISSNCSIFGSLPVPRTTARLKRFTASG